MTKRNENRPGYKKTRVGWIPNEWGIDKLRNMVERNRSIRYGIVQPGHYDPNGVFLVRGKDYSKGWVKPSEFFKVANPLDHTYRNARIQTNDILITIVGAGTGNLAKVPEWLNNANITQTTARVSINDQITDPDYCLACLSSIIGKKQVYQFIKGGAQPGLNCEHVESFNIPIPPMPEQKKIAQILSIWDKAIEQTRKLIEAKKQLKKGLMQQLLTGRMRFPQFGKPEQRETYHFYNYPSDWENPQIKEIGKEVTERNTSNDEYTVLSCSKYAGFVNSLEYFGKKVYSKDTSNYKIVKKGQFGFPANHVEEGSIGLLMHIDIGIVSPIYCVFEMDIKKVYPQYLYLLFKTEMYKHIFSVNTNASVDRRGSLRWKEFSKIHIPLPSLSEQKIIHLMFNDLDQIIDMHTKKQNALIDQKKGLMQKLLTGEVRMKN